MMVKKKLDGTVDKSYSRQADEIWVRIEILKAYC